MKVTRQLKSFSGVGSGQTATLDCQIGPTYHQVLVAFSGVTLAQMTAIRVIANGQVIHRYLSGVQLNEHNKFQGRSSASGILIIDFERYNLNTRAAREVTALGTGMPFDRTNNPTPITTLSIEFDLHVDASAPALSAKAVQSGGKPTGVIKKVKQFTPASTAAGEYQIADLPRGDLINMIRFENADVTNIKVQQNNVETFVRTKAENTLMQTDGKRVPVATAFVVDPTESGDGAEGLVTAGLNDLRFTTTLSAAGLIPTMVEYIGGLNG